jgi:hypothetical protein
MQVRPTAPTHASPACPLCHTPPRHTLRFGGGATCFLDELSGFMTSTGEAWGGGHLPSPTCQVGGDAVRPSGGPGSQCAPTPCAHATTLINHPNPNTPNTGYPAAYANALTPEGVNASRAAAAAAAAAQGGVASPTAAAAVGVESTAAQDAPAGTGLSRSSAFTQEAGVARLPLLGGAGVSAMGAAICPGVPSTPALGVKGGLTKVRGVDVGRVCVGWWCMRPARELAEGWGVDAHAL